MKSAQHAAFFMPLLNFWRLFYKVLFAVIKNLEAKSAKDGFKKRIKVYYKSALDFNCATVIDLMSSILETNSTNWALMYVQLHQCYIEILVSWLNRGLRYLDYSILCDNANDSVVAYIRTCNVKWPTACKVGQQ